VDISTSKIRKEETAVVTIFVEFARMYLDILDQNGLVGFVYVVDDDPPSKTHDSRKKKSSATTDRVLFPY